MKSKEKIGGVTITTNMMAQEPITWDELTGKQQKEFDYINTEDEQLDAHFIKCKGDVYDISQFIMTDKSSDMFEAGWHAIHSESAFSGEVIHIIENHDQIIIGSYYS